MSVTILEDVNQQLAVPEGQVRLTQARSETAVSSQFNLDGGSTSAHRAVLFEQQN